MPYSDVDQCELMVGVITRLLPRPELTPSEGATWPKPLRELMARCWAEEQDDRPDFAGVRDPVEIHSRLRRDRVEIASRSRRDITCRPRGFTTL